jgi:signal transduction histidine kinase
MGAPETSGRLAARSVMVVDDDPSHRELLAAMLGARGYGVTECADGAAALERLRSRGYRPDVIVLDLMMPVMDGWQFRVAQKRDPAIASIPVLALSADVTPKAAAIDAQLYLSKPVDEGTLAAAIDRLVVEVERRELEAQIAQVGRLTSLGTLAAGIAHEINNPLAFVLLNLEFLDKDLPDLVATATAAGDPARVARAQRMVETLSQVRVGSERIRDVVQGLRTFSRPDLESRSPLDVRAVVESAVAMLSNQLRHGARLVRDYDDDVPPVVGNDARLGQVFLNLLLNALQALPPLGGDRPAEIHLSVRAPQGAGGVAVAVRDTGSGIAPEVLGRIFEPFFTTKPVGQGTGLGLAICHGIVKAHGGTLEATSTPGQGSTFVVELPAARESARIATAGRKQPSLARRARILVVDDEPSFASTLRRLLERDHDVETVGDGREALARIRAGARYDLVVCDLMMAGMDGVDLYRALHAEVRTQADGIVFVTGGAFTERAQSFLDGVPNPRIEKPFQLDALLRVLRDRLEAQA